jgi:hypothetical protein
MSPSTWPEHKSSRINSHKTNRYRPRTYQRLRGDQPGADPGYVVATGGRRKKMFRRPRNRTNKSTCSVTWDLTAREKKCRSLQTINLSDYPSYIGNARKNIIWSDRGAETKSNC